MSKQTNQFYLGNLLFCLMPMVESLNGAFLGFHISDVYRAGLLIYILWFLLFYKRVVFEQSFHMGLVIVSFLSLNVLQFVFFYGYQLPLINDLRSASRVLLAVFYYSYFYKLIQLGLIDKKKIRALLYLLISGYVICMLIPFVFGKGLATYDVSGSGFLSADQGVGFKGFFVEINSLTAILMSGLVLIGETFFHYLKQQEKRTALLFGLFFVAECMALLITGTKTGIGFGIGYFCLLMLRVMVSSQIRLVFKVRSIMSIALLLLMIGPVVYPKMLDSLEGIFTRGEFFYGDIGNNLVQFLTSNRSNLLQRNINQLLESPDFLFIHLFGSGYYVNMSWVYERRVITEMDLFDLYFSYGISGCLIYFFYFRKSFLRFINSKFDSVSWMFVVFIVYSIFAGHVFVNAMTATFLAIISAYFLAEHEEVHL
ncbi:hypothetical protein IGI37_000218 [Enterococcus sp. AZ194]|uniref:hypothetical protein n=1 Tax=Enterococcus sp. AZ194 TaxID=2774629 RepID=UPI003F238BBA